MQGQAEQLSKIRKKFHATTYKPLYLSVTDLLSPLLVDGLLAGDALYEPHVVQLALRLVLHPLPLLRLGLQARDDRPQRLHLLPDLKVDLQ